MSQEDFNSEEMNKYDTLKEAVKNESIDQVKKLCDLHEDGGSELQLNKPNEFIVNDIVYYLYVTINYIAENYEENRRKSIDVTEVWLYDDEKDEEIIWDNYEIQNYYEKN